MLSGLRVAAGEVLCLGCSFGILWNSTRVWPLDRCPSGSTSCLWPAAGNWSFPGAVLCPAGKSHPSSIPGSCGMWHWVIPVCLGCGGESLGRELSLGTPSGFLGDAGSCPGLWDEPVLGDTCPSTGAIPQLACPASCGPARETHWSSGSLGKPRGTSPFPAGGSVAALPTIPCH